MMENPEFGGDWDDLVLALPTAASLKQLQVKGSQRTMLAFGVAAREDPTGAGARPGEEVAG